MIDILGQLFFQIEAARREFDLDVLDFAKVIAVLRQVMILPELDFFFHARKFLRHGIARGFFQSRDARLFTV